MQKMIEKTKVRVVVKVEVGVKAASKKPIKK